MNAIPRVHINGVDQVRSIQIDSLLKYGLEVVVLQQPFKVVQFDILFDCHSRWLLDFYPKRYAGNRLPPTDQQLRKLVMAGDVIDLYNTVIESNGQRFVMPAAVYTIVK